MSSDSAELFPLTELFRQIVLSDNDNAVCCSVVRALLMTMLCCSVVRALLNFGADPNFPNGDGLSSIQIALDALNQQLKTAEVGLDVFVQSYLDADRCISPLGARS